MDLVIWSLPKLIMVENKQSLKHPHMIGLEPEEQKSRDFVPFVNEQYKSLTDYYTRIDNKFKTWNSCDYLDETAYLFIFILNYF